VKHNVICPKEMRARIICWLRKQKKPYFGLVSTKSTVVWGVTPVNPAEVHRRCRGKSAKFYLTIRHHILDDNIFKGNTIPNSVFESITASLGDNYVWHRSWRNWLFSYFNQHISNEFQSNFVDLFICIFSCSGTILNGHELDGKRSRSLTHTSSGGKNGRSTSVIRKTAIGQFHPLPVLTSSPQIRKRLKFTQCSLHTQSIVTLFSYQCVVKHKKEKEEKET
jgi:hypothetical protein